MTSAQYVTDIENFLKLADQTKITASTEYAAAAAVGDIVAKQFVGGGFNLQKYAPPNPTTGQYIGYLYATAAAQVLTDLSKIFNAGPGSLVKDIGLAQAGVTTYTDIAKILNPTKALTGLTVVAAGVGDVLGIVQGYEQGGILGGIQAGYSADSLALILGAASGWALPIGITVALIAGIFGGDHDNKADMPDKYDEPAYGDGLANLTAAGKKTTDGQIPTHISYGKKYKENTKGVYDVVGARSGIETIEELLNFYGTAANAPTWLQPYFSQLEGMFGESAQGLGELSIGLGGTGLDDNNQQIVDPPGDPDAVTGLNGADYQYTDLDKAFNTFLTSMTNAETLGQPAMTWAVSSVAIPKGYGTESLESDYEFSA